MTHRLLVSKIWMVIQDHDVETVLCGHWADLRKAVSWENGLRVEIMDFQNYDMRKTDHGKAAVGSRSSSEHVRDFITTCANNLRYNIS